MHFATLLRLAFTTIGLVNGYKLVSSVDITTRAAGVARDFPTIVIALPAGETEETFSDSYLNACVSFQPALDQGLIFDFASIGPVTQPDEAEVQCQFDQADGTQVDFAKDVAVSLGATPV